MSKLGRITVLAALGVCLCTGPALAAHTAAPTTAQADTGWGEQGIHRPAPPAPGGNDAHRGPTPSA